MALTIRSAAPLNGDAVLSLAAAKAQLRRTDADEDALIASLRDAAVDWVERDTGKALAPRQFVATFDGFAHRLRLPVGPVSAVASVQYLDGDGAQQTLATTGWRLAGDVLQAAAGAAWPATLWGAAAGAVTVTFTAGFAAGHCPPGLLSAVKLLLTHLYTNRSAVVTGTIATALPFTVQSLCDQHRTMALA
jgi:uncharacterized phiE125 gp8 family phage protein